MTDKTSRIVAKADIAAIAALSETEKAYIAGFFDGEGSIGVYPKKSGFSLKLAFVQRKLEVLMWLHRVFGGALVTIIRGEPRNSTYYELRLENTAEVLRTISVFAPYVREKKDQVDAVLSAYAPHEDEVETFRSKRNVVTLLREMKRA